MEDDRQLNLVKRDGTKEAARWYIRTSRIYRDAAIDKSEKFHKEYANLYINAAEDCFKRGKKLRSEYGRTNK